MNFNSEFEKDIYEVIRATFKDAEIQCQKRFQDCRTKVSLPFDFYLPDYNLIIEADGNQHYLAARKAGGTRCWETDVIKNEYCKEKGIQLLRIRYRKYKAHKRSLLTVLKNIQLQCQETGTANCFNCWDGGEELLPISNQADINHKTKLTVTININNSEVEYITDKFTLLMDNDYYSRITGGFYIKKGKVYRSTTGKLAANEVLNIDGNPKYTLTYIDKNPFNIKKANLLLEETKGKPRGKRGAYKTSQSKNTLITWSSTTVKGKQYNSWVVKGTNGKKYFNIEKFGGKDLALKAAEKWLISEGSTTIPNGSTPKQVEMGSTLTDKAEGEDIV